MHGYEDANDANHLKYDPAFKTILDGNIVSQPTVVKVHVNSPPKTKKVHDNSPGVGSC
jgi:hypothetical protein